MKSMSSAVNRTTMLGCLTALVTKWLMSIRVPDALGLLPPRVVEVTSESPPSVGERGMSSWRKRGEVLTARSSGLTVMRRRATPPIMKGSPVTFTLRMRMAD